MTGISVAEFARRAGVSHTAIFKAIKAGKLPRLSDGSMDPGLVDGPWRKANRRGPKPKVETERRETETPEQAAERIVIDGGHAPHSLAEAERIKENYLAKLKQLEYDLKSGEVVRVADVMQIVASQYAVVRSRLLSLPAKTAPRAAILAAATEVQALLQAEINEALTALALDLAKDADEFRRSLRDRR